MSRNKVVVTYQTVFPRGTVYVETNGTWYAYVPQWERKNLAYWELGVATNTGKPAEWPMTQAEFINTLGWHNVNYALRGGK